MADMEAEELVGLSDIDDDDDDDVVQDRSVA